LAKLGKLRARKRSCRRIWESLVRYANAGDSTSSLQMQDFRKLVNNCMDWIGGVDEDIKQCRDVKGGTSLNVLAIRYRPDIKRVLAWLSAPKQHRELAFHAAEFLGLHGTGIRMCIDGNTRFDATDPEGPLVFEWPDQCDSVLSPICKFILDQIERHDIDGEKLREAIPVGMCERPRCGSFFVIERVERGRFCSSKCRAGAYQDKMTPEEKAARMRKYRARIAELKRKPIRFAKRNR
jgi:hypothetical protein